MCGLTALFSCDRRFEIDPNNLSKRVFDIINVNAEAKTSFELSTLEVDYVCFGAGNMAVKEPIRLSDLDKSDFVGRLSRRTSEDQYSVVTIKDGVVGSYFYSERNKKFQSQVQCFETENRIFYFHHHYSKSPALGGGTKAVKDRYITLSSSKVR